MNDGWRRTLSIYRYPYIVRFLQYPLLTDIPAEPPPEGDLVAAVRVHGGTHHATTAEEVGYGRMSTVLLVEDYASPISLQYSYFRTFEYITP